MDPRIRQLYKNLLFMGKDYPINLGGYEKFRRILKTKFQTTPVTNESELKNALDQGNYIIKELEALFYLSKYRYLKRTYS